MSVTGTSGRSRLLPNSRLAHVAVVVVVVLEMLRARD